MNSLEEIIRINNPEPGGYKKQVAKNIKRDSRLEIIHLSELPWEKKQERLHNLFEGK